MVIKKLASELGMEARTLVYQRSQEQWTKEATKDSKWKEVTNVQNEIGSLIKEGHVAIGAVRRTEREQYLLAMAEELQTQGSKDE